MTDSKKLAEELREAAKRADYFQTGEQGLLNRAAEVIGALSAHTPTDDEREALIEHALNIATKGVQINDGHRYMVPARDLVEYAETIKALIELLRRSEVPEPRAERVTRSTVLREESMYLRERISDAESARDEHPKDSQAWRALNELLNAMRREANRLSLRADEFASEPQGEPSDARAKVIDALVMTRLSDSAGTDMSVIEQAADAVLAALRAAGGVR